MLIALAQFREPSDSKFYSAPPFERAEDCYEILSLENGSKTKPKPSKLQPQIITVRATGIGSPPATYDLRVWVDRDTGRLRISDVGQERLGCVDGISDMLF